MLSGILEIAVLAFAPGVFGLAYFYYGARYPDEKSSPLLIAHLAGMASAPLALLLFHGFDSVSEYDRLFNSSVPPSEGLLLVYSLFVIGPVEEIAKLVALRFSLYFRKEFNHPLDGLTYSGAVALGFASVENWYAMMELREMDWARALTLPFLHILFSSFWGVGLSLAKFGKDRRTRQMVFVGLPLAFLYHGLFDYIVLSEGISNLWTLPLVLILWFWVSSSLRRIRDNPIDTIVNQDLRVS